MELLLLIVTVAPLFTSIYRAYSIVHAEKVDVEPE